MSAQAIYLADPFVDPLADPLAPPTAPAIAEPAIHATRRRATFERLLASPSPGEALQTALPRLLPTPGDQPPFGTAPSQSATTASDHSAPQTDNRAAFDPSLLLTTELPPEVTVALLYQNILGREPDDAGLTGSASKVATSGPRAIKQIAAQFGASAELQGAGAAQQARAAQFLAAMGVMPRRKRHRIVRFASHVARLGWSLTQRVIHTVAIGIRYVASHLKRGKPAAAEPGDSATLSDGTTLSSGAAPGDRR